MPVASFVATGTSCGRHPVAARARGVPLPQAPAPPQRALFRRTNRFAAAFRPAAVPRKDLRAAVRYRHPLRRRRNAPSLRSFSGAPWSVSTLKKMKREAAHSAARSKVSGKNRCRLPDPPAFREHSGAADCPPPPFFVFLRRSGRPAHSGAAPGKHALERFNFEKGETRGGDTAPPGPK